MSKYITIIGSREITEEERNDLYNIAKSYHDKGYTLRSGGAEGSDSVINSFENVEIIIPKDNFNGLAHDGKRIFTLTRLKDIKVARKIAERIHPVFNSLTHGVKKLHTRNIYQITGSAGVNKENLSEKVYYIADEINNEVKGGTRTAVELARSLGIETVNIRGCNGFDGR